ncbi:MAG: hypothetical protein WD716_09000 [Fimbriimonadaceae bacterium]
MLRNDHKISQAYIVRCHLAVEQFKVCPLCGAVNVAGNDECFCCRWSGGFKTGRHEVESRLYELIHRCPELLAVLSEEGDDLPPTLFDRVRSFFSRLRGLDLRA